MRNPLTMLFGGSLCRLLLIGCFPVVGAAQTIEGVPKTLGVDAAVASRDAALDWFLREQSPDGSWGSGSLEELAEAGYSVESYYAWKVSAHALACMALLLAPPDGPRGAACHASLLKAYDFLCTTRPTKRGSDWDIDYVWTGLYGFVACIAAIDDPRFQGDDWRPRIETAGRGFLDILRKNQVPTGGWAYYDNPPYSRRPKWATSFCTALVLPALQRALELGWETDDGILERAVRYVKRCALPNGAWAYDLRPVPRVTGGEHIDDVKGSLARIQVCNWGLAELGEPRITPDRIRTGLEEFFEYHRFLDVAWQRPIPHEAYYANSGYFYLFGHYYAARAIELLPKAERESWHARLRPHLTKVQRKDGSTSDYLTSTYLRVAGTAYLALALTHGIPSAED